MKANTHPRYYHNCKVYHNGQVVLTTGATVPELHVEVWSGSHPFFTGKQTFVDAAGRVEKFQRKFHGEYFKKGGKEGPKVPEAKPMDPKIETRPEPAPADAAPAEVKAEPKA